MGKRAEQREQQRRHLLDVSLDLFVRRGYHGTTVREIAKQAHTSVGLLFHYFPTKQAILEELAAFSAVGTSSAMNLLAAPLAPIDIFAQIAEMSLRFLEEPLASRLFLLVNQIRTSDAIPEDIKRIVSSSDVVRVSVPTIARGQQREEIRPGDPLALSLAFWGALQGIAELRLWFPDAPVPDASWVVDALRRSRE